MSFLCLLLLAAAVSGARDAQVSQTAGPLAVPGQMWKTRVGNKLPRECAFSAIRFAGAEPSLYYHFNIRLEEADAATDGGAGWKLLLLPGFGFPRNHYMDYEVFGDWTHGWPRQLRRRRAWLNELTAVNNAIRPWEDDAAFFTEPIDFFPVEFFPFFPDREWKAKGESLRIRTEDLGRYYLVELTQSTEEREVLRIRQKWEKGEIWWAEYDRWVDGKKTLNVLRGFDFSDGKELPDDHELKQQGITDRNGYNPRFMSLDKRLQVKVDFRRIRPTLDDLFQVAHEKAGVRLSRHPSLPTDCNPYLGEIQLDDYPLWGVMEVLALIGFDDGQWEVDGDGYRLKGKPKPLPDWLPKQNSGYTRWLIGITISIGVVISLLYFWRRRVRPKKAVEQKQRYINRAEP